MTRGYGVFRTKAANRDASDRAWGLSNLLRYPLLIFIMTAFLVKPDSLSVLYPKLSTLYNLISVGVFLFLILMAITSLRITKITLSVILFQGTILAVTYFKGGNLVSAFSVFFRVVGLCVLIEMGAQNFPIKLAEGVLALFFMYLFLNLCTVLVFPKGLYLSTETGNPCFFLGHRNVLFRTLLPGLLMAYVFDYQRRGSIGVPTLVYYFFLAVTAVAVWSASSLVVLAFIPCLVFLFRKRSWFLRHGALFSLCSGAFGTILLVILRLQYLFSYLIVDLLHKDLTLTSRTKVWDFALNAVGACPITGYGVTEPVVAQLRFGGVNSAHNYFLDTMYYGGYLALAALLICVLVVDNGLRRAPSGIALPVVACLTAFFLLGVVEPNGIGLSYMVIPFAIAYHAASFAHSSDCVCED